MLEDLKITWRNLCRTTLWILWMKILSHSQLLNQQIREPIAHYLTIFQTFRCSVSRMRKATIKNEELPTPAELIHNQGRDQQMWQTRLSWTMSLWCIQIWVSSWTWIYSLSTPLQSRHNLDTLKKCSRKREGNHSSLKMMSRYRSLYSQCVTS